MVLFSSQTLPLAASLVFVSVANAQVALYGQCGGQGYAGSTTCVSGTICQAQNDYYSQCVPGTASSAVSSAASTLRTTTAAPTSSAASVTKAATSAQAAPSANSGAAAGTKYLMIFGDSYSSDGFWPGGTPPAAGNPLGVSLPGTTTSGGLNWVGVTATQLNTSLYLAFDYAEYGATTDNTLVNGATHDFVSQVTEFQTYTAHNASSIPWTADNTMAIVWIGINDVGNKYWNNSPVTIDAFLNRYFQQLQRLYDAGIRYFTIFTVPPFDRAPVFAQQTADGLTHLRANITAYNDGLAKRIATFKSANSGVKGNIFTTSDSFTTILNNPTAYGSKDASCMNSDGKTCLWYDNYHPGLAIQKLVAQNFVKALTGVFF